MTVALLAWVWLAGFLMGLAVMGHGVTDWF